MASAPPPPRQGSAGAVPRDFSAREGLAFVREHGVVLVSARGPARNLVEAIVGAPVAGSWWGHAEGKRIFSILTAVTESNEVLVCRLVDGKITLVHRRLWPALVRLADAFPPDRIARVLDGHTASGRHERRSVAFPEWVPPAIAQEANALGESEARALIGGWLPQGPATRRG